MDTRDKSKFLEIYRERKCKRCNNIVTCTTDGNMVKNIGVFNKAPDNVITPYWRDLGAKYYEDRDFYIMHLDRDIYGACKYLMLNHTNIDEELRVLDTRIEKIRERYQNA